MACPARDEADELALVMFSQLLDPNRYQIDLFAEESLTAEIIEQLRKKTGADMYRLLAAPDGLAHTDRFVSGFASDFRDQNPGGCMGSRRKGQYR